jgi:hypothetical protein
MIVATAAWAYLAISRAASNAPMSEPLLRPLSTTQGLITLVGAAQPFLRAIAIIIVTANVAAEWSQGTLRNLLVREPGRLRLLAGKQLALLFFVTLCAALAMLAGAGMTLAAAQAHGISTAPWTTSDGVNAFVRFFGNDLLSLVGISLLGLFIAVLTRSVGAAVGISLAYVLVVEGLIEAVWPDGAQWFPAHLFGYLQGTASPMSYGVPPMGYTSDLIVALAWMAGLLVASAVLFRWRDVSA